MLLMPGNKGFSFDRLVGAFVEIVETVSDSQVNDSAGDDEPCDQKHPIPAKPGLGPFQCSPAQKPKMTERMRQSAQLSPGIEDENQGAIPEDLKKCRNVP